ncbi:MAG: response regulator [Proteobacteria bacterium]|nr:response regulator [Pseudomonadota bacterium]
MSYIGSSQTVNSRGAAPTGRRRPISLVLVDDDDDFREAAAGELEDLGFTVQSFGDGTDMLAAFARGMRADVIVLDWYMPAMMGIDVLAHVRRSGNYLPVVFLTGHSTVGLKEIALKGGAVDFMDKMGGIPSLAERVQGILEPSKVSG